MSESELAAARLSRLIGLAILEAKRIDPEFDKATPRYQDNNTAAPEDKISPGWLKYNPILMEVPKVQYTAACGNASLWWLHISYPAFKKRWASLGLDIEQLTLIPHDESRTEREAEAEACAISHA